MNEDLKKQIVLNSPYLLFVYLFDKLSQAYRILNVDISKKLLYLGTGLEYAFSHPLPSIHYIDLLIGILGALFIRLLVYSKSKNSKKYRQGMEYGSARWGAYYQLQGIVYGRKGGQRHDAVQQDHRAILPPFSW